MTQSKITSDLNHNENCYEYLKILVAKMPEEVLKNIEKFSPSLSANLSKIKDQTHYDGNTAYGDIYKEFFDVTEDNIDDIIEAYYKKLNDELKYLYNPVKHTDKAFSFVSNYANNEKKEQLEKELKNLNDFIFSIYANDNKVLPKTYQKIKHIPSNVNPSSPSIESSIAKHVADKGEKINQNSNSPAEVEWWFNRLVSVFSDTFKPQHATSISTKVSYGYNDAKENPWQQYRTGTMAQRHEGDARVAPLWKRWLKVYKELYPRDEKSPSPYNHLYINNLGLDRPDLLDIEGRKEAAMSEALHKLEDDSELGNIAVITLPADKGLMDQSDYKKTEKNLNVKKVFDEFLQIATEDPNTERKIKDFRISPMVRNYLFNDKGEYSKEFEKETLTRLVTESFKELGIDPDHSEPISIAQRQAVWFLFTKSKLTHYIINTLMPTSFSIQCKDAIDRAAVASSLLHLINPNSQHGRDAIDRIDEVNGKKINLTREEFECSLDAAATMVKGRGLNHHRHLIWNTLDVYLNNEANYKEIKADPNQAWLIEWRDLNCPQDRVQELLTDRIPKIKEELKALETDPAKGVQAKVGVEILELIEKQNKDNVSGNCLLLEAAVLTQKLISNPNEDLGERYEALGSKLSVFSGFGSLIAGLMQTLIGMIIYPLNKKVMDEGIATFNTGHDALTTNHRGDLISKMSLFKGKLEDLKKVDEREVLDVPNEYKI